MAATGSGSGYTVRKKPRWWLIAAIVLFHILVLAGLARALAPDFTAGIVEDATSLITVTVTAPEPPPPPPPDVEPEPDEGASGEEGREATAREVMAPEPKVKIPPKQAAPKAASTGNANQSGARDRGDGTGAGGPGDGTGSGNGGNGSGNGISPIVSRPSLKSGSLNESRDFPTPRGGRQVRFGTSITVMFTVGVDGRARNCRVTDPGPDPATNAVLCPLVEQRLTFNPARRANGEPVAAEYGWIQRFGRK
ncbi:hypothetical protein [Paraurantiacibacter namhicola]|uniref:Gram-negative bacterial tonB protein n=1 Tax=Paraurantiacibacter namhicola TaxID=645517 RepID=A0A1C7D712_9SPHN|nr:hypothetical protein [Paraurantiacibacter namhicola]ANU07111.1 hypothetical protein A6F65_00792 [Paraurantiacibacter namhicola]